MSGWLDFLRKTLGWPSVRVVGTPLRWVGRTNLHVAWTGRTNLHVAWTGRTSLVIRWSPPSRYEVRPSMIQYRLPVRVNTPQQLIYTFKDETGAVIDLTGYLSVELQVKEQGSTYTHSAGTFDADRTTGKVYFDAKQFDSPGQWTAQFVATNAQSLPVYGEPIQLTVVLNTDELATEQLPDY